MYFMFIFYSWKYIVQNNVSFGNERFAGWVNRG